MTWRNITQKDIDAAVREAVLEGMTKFRTLHGDFYEANGMYVHINSTGPFEARPLIAAAYAHMKKASGVQNQKMTPLDFSGIDAHEFLRAKFKFSIKENSIGL